VTDFIDDSFIKKSSDRNAEAVAQGFSGVDLIIPD